MSGADEDEGLRKRVSPRGDSESFNLEAVVGVHVGATVIEHSRSVVLPTGGAEVGDIGTGDDDEGLLAP
jgi:hypothetical protein